MPTVFWKCENCQKTKEGGLRPPKGWVEVSFWDGLRNKFHRFSLCSYKCAGKWCQNRYDEPQEVNNG